MCACVCVCAHMMTTLKQSWGFLMTKFNKSPYKILVTDVIPCECPDSLPFSSLEIIFAKAEHKTLQILNICTKKQEQPRTKSLLSISKLWAEKHTSPCFQPFNMLIWKWTFSHPCLLVSPFLPTKELEESCWFLGTVFSCSVPAKLPYWKKSAAQQGNRKSKRLS